MLSLQPSPSLHQRSTWVLALLAVAGLSFFTGCDEIRRFLNSPIVEITAPRSGDVVAEPSVEVIGTVSTGSDLAELVFTLNGGEPTSILDTYDVVQGRFAFTAEGLVLGNNVIVVRATTVDEYFGVGSVTVVYRVGPDPLRCADLSCGDQNRACIEGEGQNDATCGACLEGFVEDGGVCVEETTGPLTCADLACGDENRACEEGDEGEDAACDACLEGFTDEEGVCVEDPAAPLTCDDLACEDDDRACIEGDEGEDAICGDCLEGFTEIEEVCVPFLTCADLTCADDNRECTEGDGSADAVCGGCLPGFVDDQGVCVEEG